MNMVFDEIKEREFVSCNDNKRTCDGQIHFHGEEIVINMLLSNQSLIYIYTHTHKGENFNIQGD